MTLISDSHQAGGLRVDAAVTGEVTAAFDRLVRQRDGMTLQTFPSSFR